MKRLFSLWLIVLLLAGFVLTGCGGSGRGTAVAHNHPMAPLDTMPLEVQRSGRKMQEAYQFAVANPQIADNIPCYCGCASMGHTSNYDCYVAGQTENGDTQFDEHAQYCSICIDITQDTMRMMDEGKTTADIFTQIELDYGRFGPPTVKPEAGKTS